MSSVLPRPNFGRGIYTENFKKIGNNKYPKTPRKSSTVHKPKILQNLKSAKKLDMSRVLIHQDSNMDLSLRLDEQIEWLVQKKSHDYSFNFKTGHPIYKNNSEYEYECISGQDCLNFWLSDGIFELKNVLNTPKKSIQTANNKNTKIEIFCNKAKSSQKRKYSPFDASKMYIRRD